MTSCQTNTYPCGVQEETTPYFHVQWLFLFPCHGGGSGSDHTKSINIGITCEKRISWNTDTCMGVIHSICCHYLSNLLFKELILDFMSRKNDIQAGIINTTKQYLLSTTGEQGLNCCFQFESNIAETPLQLSVQRGTRGPSTGLCPDNFVLIGPHPPALSISKHLPLTLSLFNTLGDTQDHTECCVQHQHWCKGFCRRQRLPGAQRMAPVACSSKLEHHHQERNPSCCCALTTHPI